jgi:hypothetical protein
VSPDMWYFPGNYPGTVDPLATLDGAVVAQRHARHITFTIVPQHSPSLS